MSQIRLQINMKDMICYLISRLAALFSTILQLSSTSTVEPVDLVRDKISELPVDVLYSIIECLTMRAAVKTSVLSQRWKRVYSCRSTLRFSQFNMLHTSKHCSQCRDEFVKGVNEFLDSYQGTQIDSFFVSFCLGSDFADDIDRWISFANRMGAKKIAIDLYCQRYCCAITNDDMHGARIEGKHIIRWEVFGGRNTNLKSLELGGCILEPNITNQFSCLEALELFHSCLATYDMHGLFSCLVKLKHLALSTSTLPAKLCLGSLVLLKSLVIVGSAGIEEVQLSNNVNLYSVICSCKKLVKFDFAGAPNLQKIHYSAFRRDKLRYIFTHLPKQAPALTTLSFHTTSDTVDQHILKGIVSFEQVTNLCLLFSYDTEFDFSKIISVLGAFPCLRKLIILKRGSGESEHSNFVPDESEDNRGKEDGISHTSSQVEFDNYLLKHGICMEQMVCKQGEKFGIGHRNGMYSTVSKRLLEFSEEAAMYIH